VSERPVEPSAWLEVAGRTVPEAVEAGLERLGLASPDQAEIEVLDEPQRGLLGVLGGRGARVRLRPRNDRVEAVTRLVRDIVAALGLAGTEVAVSRDDDGYIRVTLKGSGLGVLIGRRGETLDALQYLLNLASARVPGPPARVILDAGDYRERRRRTLEKLVERISDRVRRTGREVVLEPMSPQERKMVHLAVAAQEGVRSESRGEEPLRRVVVCPVDDDRA